MPVDRRLKLLVGLLVLVVMRSPAFAGRATYTMKELLSSQQFEPLENPFPLTVRLMSTTVDETAGWNGGLDDRWHSSDAFRGGYAQEFLDGLALYLKARGFTLGNAKDALQVRVNIDRFTGRRSNHNDGGDLKGTLVLRLNGKEIRRKPLFESLTYQNESSECEAFAKQFGLHEVQFPTVLFYLLTVSFYASIADAILEAGTSPESAKPPSTPQTAPSESGKTGLLTIESIPDTAEIYLDSRLLATTPASRIRLSVGHHSITLKKAGFADWVREVVVLEDSDLTLKATLEQLPP